jgi:acetyl esterase/lipase
MDYRLAPTSQWPAMPNDVASALSFLKKEVAARGADSRKIFLFGHSSGCHLASIVGTNPVYLRSAGLDPGSVAGVIAMGCILDRDDATIRQLTADKIRSAFNRDAQDVRTYGTPENYLAANPASFVSDSSARTLVIVADAERFMPAVMEQGARFVRLLLEHNVAANLVVVPGTHSSSIASLNKPDDPSLRAILRFMADPAKSAAAH